MDEYCELWKNESDPDDVDYDGGNDVDIMESEDGSEEVDVMDSEERRNAEQLEADLALEDPDEEEIIDRFEDEVEESVAQFVDELVTPRNTIPDSSDSEDDELPRDRKIRRGLCTNLELGQTFLNRLQFKEAALNYALISGRNIKQNRWDNDKVSFICGVKSCLWRVYASYDRSKQLWIVKTSSGAKHTCAKSGKCLMLKSPMIGRLFMDKLREDPDYMPTKIQDHIKNQWKFITTRGQCQCARNLGVRWIKMENANQFAHLRGYCQEIQHSNLGSHVVLDTVPNSKGEDVFSRFYVCYEILRSTWRGSCRPIIGVDGTFLKRAVKGVLLSVVGHDANNQIYPIAWAVVQSETNDNWLWFINLLKIDLMLDDGNGFVIISDRCRVSV